MPGPFIPVVSLSRSQSIRIGSAQGGTTGVGALNIPNGFAGVVAAGGSLTAGTYYYKITSTNGRGGETKPTAEVNVTTATTNLTAALTWNAVQGAAGYNVYRGTSTGQEVYLTSVITNSFSDVGALTPGISAVAPPTSDTSGLGGRIVPQLAQNPSTASLPLPSLVDLSDGSSRRDLGHHIAIGDVVPMTPLRLTNSLAANTAAIGSTPTVVNFLQLPANVLNVGSSVRINVQGVTSATGNVTVAAKVGAAGTTADATLTTQTVAGATGGGGFEWSLVASTQAVGSGTNGKLMSNAQFAAHTNAQLLTANTTQFNVDTTIPEYLTVVVSVSAGTVTVTNSLIEFLDAQF